MIEINLVPQHLRKKQRSKFFLSRMNIPLEIIIGCGGGLLALLILVHVLLLFFNFRQLVRHKGLQRQWEAMRPDKERVDSVVNEMRVYQGKYKAIEEISGKSGLLWAQKLNVISDNLPRGLWLKKVALNDKAFIIEGSATAKETTEIISIHQLTSRLKNEKDFLRHFTDLEIGSIQRRRLNSVEIADFLITMKLK